MRGSRIAPSRPQALWELQHHVQIARLIFRAALLVTALGLVLALAVPGGDRIVDVGAMVCAVAAWILPLLVLAQSWIRKPQTSLASVGITISAFVFAAIASVASLVLALLSLSFARVVEWAWLSLLIVAALWLLVVLLGAIASRFAQGRGETHQGPQS
jgi:hypothetical protein